MSKSAGGAIAVFLIFYLETILNIFKLIGYEIIYENCTLIIFKAIIDWWIIESF
jgi:hypothetical protein